MRRRITVQLLLLALILVCGGCAAAPWSIHLNEPHHGTFENFVRQRGITVGYDSSHNFQLPDCAASRAAVETYLVLTRKRLAVVETNILNSETILDTHGHNCPYRRRIASISSGRLVVREDPSAFEVRYQPEHPYANACGYVLFPNVNAAVERIFLESIKSECSLLEAALAQKK